MNGRDGNQGERIEMSTCGYYALLANTLRNTQPFYLIKNLDEFADLSNFDLLDNQEGIFKDLGLDEAVVNNMIMKAREKWFTDEKES